MKQYCIFSLLFFSLLANAQIVNIPDAAFKTKLMASSPTANIAKNQAGQKIKIDANNDGNIQESEAALVYWMNVNNSNIANLTGIGSFVNLKTLICNNNELTSLDVSMLPLQELVLSNNNLNSLNITGLTNLHILDYVNNYLPTLDLSDCINLTDLSCANNEITSLNISGFSQLASMNCSRNNLTTLDLTGLTALKYFNCSENQITSLDFSGLTLLVDIDCSQNNLTALNLSGLTFLEQVDCSENSISSFITGVNVLHTLTLNNNSLTSLDVTGMPTLKYLYCNNNLLTSINTTGLPLLKKLECSYNNLSALGLNELPVLEWLTCNNNHLTSLDFSGSPSILRLNCGFNNFVTLDVTLLTLLDSLNCDSNQLTNLNVVGLQYLYDLNCSNNQLSQVDLTGTTIFDYNCAHNMFTELDFSNQGFDYLDCSFNPLALLKLGDIENIDARSTLISSLTFTHKFYFVILHDNPNLVSLFMKNNEEDMDVSMLNVPNLAYICADDADIPNMQYWNLSSVGLDNIEINNYCTYTPGAFYDISGHQQLDLDNNGCGPTDIAYPNLHLDITNGVVHGTIIADTTGNYTIPVQAGTHTLTPVFEMPYFTATPASVNVMFPTSVSPAVQDFCITPNGSHPDVEISVFNLDTAVPGFDASYKIVYKNTGTTTASGAVNFSFDDETLDFVSANPIADSQSTGLLSWNYNNLQPFETRMLTLSLNLNSPVETPPLNMADILTFAANISLPSDETLANNTATLNQTVFNSFDPNDKTCLEGDTITPNMVGQYVHYRIRFENTGNYPAAIVTVKDVIDTSKFDISTLTPITASHPFITRISNTNQVEFVFDNILLPFEDANNDGYVVFKIKTKPTLVLGDELSNTAGIYFNYNAPVITNTAVTTVAIPLSTDENENTFGFALYPNPVKDVLNIASKVNVAIDSVIIYNTLGQEVMKVIPAVGDYGIDVSRLPVGSYVIKVFSDNKSWSSQFLKQN